MDKYLEYFVKDMIKKHYFDGITVTDFINFCNLELEINYEPLKQMLDKRSWFIKLYKSTEQMILIEIEKLGYEIIENPTCGCGGNIWRVK